MAIGDIIAREREDDVSVLSSPEVLRMRGVGALTARKCYFNFWKHKPYSKVGGQFPCRKVHNDYFCELRPVTKDNEYTNPKHDVDAINAKVQCAVVKREKEEIKTPVKKKGRPRKTS